MELKDMVPALGFLFTVFLGVVGWRVQLIGKRRTELAEEALLAFARAHDALRQARSPFVSNHELAKMRQALELPEQDSDPRDSYLVVLWRLQKIADDFTALRRLQLLCRFHFGEEADRAFGTIQNARNSVWDAAEMLRETFDSQVNDSETEVMRRSWRQDINASGGPRDKIGLALRKSQAELEALLTPHLRADAALIPVRLAWSAAWRRLRAWMKSVIYGPTPLAGPPPR